MKTGREDELTRYSDLLSRQCPVRYVVTCNALKEGWDCSFAYVLVSASNMGTLLSVEQIIGRVLRLPNAKRKRLEPLNRSYVFTASRRFDDAARAVVQGLEQNGYSKHDVMRSDNEEQRTDYEAIRAATDAEFSLPYLAIEGQPLDFYDLIPEDFSLRGSKPSPALLDELENRASVIDVEESAVTVSAQHRLKLLHLSEEETQEELIRWLCRSVREQSITMKEMQAFTSDVVGVLLEERPLAQLYAQKFSIRDVVAALMRKTLTDEAERTFRSLLTKRKITPSTGEQWHIPQKLTLLHPMREPFRQHLFDRCDDLNDEELALARQLDAHPAIVWWLRNVACNGDGLHLQGYRPNRFYPVFIVRTRKGAWWLLEYKGEDRLGSLDTSYKEELGKVWASRCGTGFHFALVTAENMANVLSEVGA